jgi:hypothetical protein
LVKRFQTAVLGGVAVGLWSLAFPLQGADRSVDQSGDFRFSSLFTDRVYREGDFIPFRWEVPSSVRRYTIRLVLVTPERERLLLAGQNVPGHYLWRIDLDAPSAEYRVRLEVHTPYEEQLLFAQETPRPLRVDNTVPGGRVLGPREAPTGKVAVEYEAKDEGGAGLASVELWWSRDGGKKWDLAAIDTDGTSPLGLQGEPGDYGLRLVAIDRAGNASARPRPGDTPEGELRLIPTAPVGSLDLEELAPFVSPGTAIPIRWKVWGPGIAQDASVALRCRWSRSEDWHLLASGLPLEGSHRWVLPEGTYECFRLRLDLEQGKETVELAARPLLVSVSDRAPEVVLYTQDQWAEEGPVKIRYHTRLRGGAPFDQLSFWIRPVGGTHWTMAGNSPDPFGPVELDLADGFYEVYAAARDRLGNHAPDPGPASEPMQRILVDRRPPDIGSQIEQKGEEILIRWWVSDPNLEEGSVSIFYAPEYDLRWVFVAERLPERGEYRWIPPEDVSRFRMKIEARDRAGRRAEEVRDHQIVIVERLVQVTTKVVQVVPLEVPIEKTAPSEEIAEPAEGEAAGGGPAVLSEEGRLPFSGMESEEIMESAEGESAFRESSLPVLEGVRRVASSEELSESAEREARATAGPAVISAAKPVPAAETIEELVEAAEGEAQQRAGDLLERPAAQRIPPEGIEEWAGVPRERPDQGERMVATSDLPRQAGEREPVKPPVASAVTPVKPPEPAVPEADAAFVRMTLALGEGKVFRGGSAVPIRWESDRTDDPLLVEFSRDGGAHWEPIKRVPVDFAETWIELPRIDASDCAVRLRLTVGARSVLSEASRFAVSTTPPEAVLILLPPVQGEPPRGPVESKPVPPEPPADSVPEPRKDSEVPRSDGDRPPAPDEGSAPEGEAGVGWVGELDSLRGLLQEGKVDEAVAGLERLAHRHPESSSVRYELARAYRTRGHPQEVVRKLLEQVITLDPSHAEALNDLGALYVMEGDLERARELLQRAIDAGGFARAYYNLGLVHRLARQDVQAIAPFQEAVRRDPELRDAYWQLALVFSSDPSLDRQEARRYWELVARHFPDDPAKVERARAELAGR